MSGSPPSNPHEPLTTPPVDTSGLDWVLSWSGQDASRRTVIDHGIAPDLQELRLPQIPGYDVLGVLGRGGMGVVYQARHAALNRTVALKMIRGGADASPHDLARFRAEAEAVARLSHAHIVQVFDVGTHEGQPYCALELLAGGSLDQHLLGKPQPPFQAATLVEQLAQAMQAAHDQGIIHRDLKPSNILLTAEGTPKITDFGLAKCLESTNGQTRTGEVVGTPAYMAPEQAAGQNDRVGPAADIYALGTILYEMLTGRPPFLGVAPTDVLLQVMSTEPVPPGRLQPLLPADLETICLKCLQKEPQQRYLTAAALAEDLHRFLTDQPIVARPVTLGERCWRWCRRNPLPATLAATALVLGLTLAIGGPVAALREAHLRQEAEDARATALREKDRAEEAQRRTWAALDAMTSQVASDWLTAQKELRPEQVRFLENAVLFYREFAADPARDARGRMRTALGNHQLASLLHRLGKKTEAEAAYRQSLTLLERLATEYPDDPKYREQEAVVQGHLGVLLVQVGRLAEAEAAYRRNIAIFTALLDHQPVWPAVRLNLAAGYGNLGVLLAELGQKDAAAEYHRQAQELFVKLVTEFPKDPNHRRNLASSSGNRAVLLRDLGRWPEAEAAALRALELRRQLAAEAPDDAPARRDVAASLLILGDYYRESVKLDAADQAFREATSLMEQLVAEFPTLPEYRHALALVRNKHSLLLGRLGRWPEAEAALRQAMPLWVRLLDEFPDRPTYRFALGGCRSNLGMARAALGRREEAEQDYQAALELQEALAKDFPSNPEYREELAITHASLAMLLREQSRWAEAEQHMGRTLELRAKLAQELPKSLTHRRQLAVAYNEMGVIYTLQKKHAASEQVQRQSLGLQEQLVAEFPRAPSLHIDLAGSCCNFGNLLKTKGRHAESLEWFTRAIKLLEGVLAQESRQSIARRFLRNSLASRAAALEALERPLDALPDWGRTIAVDDQKVDLFRQKFSAAQTRVMTQLRRQAAENPTAAAEAAATLAPTPGLPGEMLVDLARLCNRAMTTTDATQKERHASQALALLQRAKQAGAFPDAARAVLLRQHADWAALRPRADFQAFLKSLPQ